MPMIIHDFSLEEATGTGISEARLRGRQSIRTTFRLPVDLIELLGIVAGQFGLKQKSLFDQLIDDIEVLNEVAESVPGYAPENIERRPKTYVISKQSLYALERVAEERRISRDILVEISIRRLLPVLFAEREKHFKRAEILGELQSYLRHGEDLRAQAENLLGKSDPVCAMIGRMVRLGEETAMGLAGIVARGKTLENVRVERFFGGMANGG